MTLLGEPGLHDLDRESGDDCAVEYEIVQHVGIVLVLAQYAFELSAVVLPVACPDLSDEPPAGTGHARPRRLALRPGEWSAGHHMNRQQTGHPIRWWSHEPHDVIGPA